MSQQFKNFAEFYPFYLQEHRHRTSRRLHFIGSSLALCLFALALFFQQWPLLLLALLQGYAFAWVGHFFFEHNKPATFRYPWLSFLGDWRMWYEIACGKIRF